MASYRSVPPVGPYSSGKPTGVKETLTLLVNARRSFFHPPRGGCTRGMFLILLGFKHGALDHCFECFGINQQSRLWRGLCPLFCCLAYVAVTVNSKSSARNSACTLVRCGLP